MNKFLRFRVVSQLEQIANPVLFEKIEPCDFKWKGEFGREHRCFLDVHHDGPHSCGWCEAFNRINSDS